MIQLCRNKILELFDRDEIEDFKDRYILDSAAVNPISLLTPLAFFGPLVHVSLL